MSIQDLDNKIKAISAKCKIDEQEVFSRIDAYLDINFSDIDYSEEDKIIIKGIKEKIMSTLYNSVGQKIRTTRATKLDVLFDLDIVEMKLLDDSFKQLYADGFVNSEYDEIILTDIGVREYRKNN